RPRIALVFEIAEGEQSVLEDRTARPYPGGARVEGAGVEGQSLRLGADEALVAEPMVHRSGEMVRAASRHGIDSGADEVALTNIVRGDVHLHLLDALERYRCDTGAIAGLPSEAERVGEIRATDGHLGDVD